MSKPSLYHLDADDYVHVVQTTGRTIVGLFDGQRYEFQDGVPSDPVHWRVAHHLFGFRGTQVAKENAIHRLGWMHNMTMETALDMLNKCFRYDPLELLPKGVVEFRREAQNADDTLMPTGGPSSVGTEAPLGTSTSSAPGASPDPLRKAKRG